MLAAAQRHGDLAPIRLGRREYWVLSDPEDIEDVLVRRQREFRRAVPPSWGLRRHGRAPEPTAPPRTPEDHLALRRLVQPGFSRGRLGERRDLVDRISVEHVERWRDGAGIDLLAELEPLTLAIALRVVFDSRLHASEETMSAAREALLFLRSDPTHPLSWLVRRARWRRLLAAEASFAAVDELLRALLEERRGGRDPFSLLRDAEGFDEDDRLAVAQVLLFASIDPMPVWAAWTLYLLASTRDAAERVAGEVAAGGAREESSYTRGLLSEALRLYPPVWRIGKIALREQRFRAGRVRAGSTIWISPYVVHRDPRWWDEPEEFRPERWLLEADRPKLAFLPFAAGAHKCLGDALAWDEMFAIVEAVASRWELHPTGSLEYDAGTTLRPTTAHVLLAGCVR